MQRSVKDWGGIIAAFLLVIVVNGMANGVPLGGRTTGEISAAYPTLFTPAGFTFGIWGLIYTLLTCFVVYQALPAQRNSSTLAAISTLFIANCAANAAWIFVWHYDFIWLSLLLMFCILITLIMIYRALESAGPPASKAEWLFVRAPFSLYVGWITVATIANISVLQTSMGWNNVLLPELDWTLLKLAIGGAIGATIILRKQDIVYVLVIAWAAYGVASKQVETPEIVGAASVLSILAVLLALQAAVRRS